MTTTNKAKIKYKFIHADTVEQLNEKVNRYLVEGWELYGYPVVVHSSISGKMHFMQVVILEMN